MGKEVKHHDYGKKVRVKHLDELLSHTATQHYAEIGDALKDTHNFMNEDHIAHLNASMLIPGFQKLYDATTKAIDEAFKDTKGKIDGSKSLYNKEKELKTAIVKGILAYLEHTHPEQFKTVSDAVDKKKPEEAYDFITQYMDKTVLGLREGQSFYQGMAKMYADEEDMTIDKFKVAFDQHGKDTKARHIQSLISHKAAANLGKFGRGIVAKYMMDKVVGGKDSQYEVKNKQKFLNMELDDMLGLYDAYQTGKFEMEGKPVKPTAYHLQKKKPAAK